MASVIPINLSIPVPPHGDTSGGNVRYAYSAPADPLVNKFPGDWIPTVTDTPPTNFPPLSGAPPPSTPPATPIPYSYQYYSEASLRQTLQDPDSYWAPQADCGISTKADLNSATLNETLIPRSARMPNIGYLQYIRTGIIPDDESAAYQTQHGTPFRLLSFGPSGDSSQTVRGGNYPDWAMLDLFYIPSILNSFGGPYASNTNLAPFGTYGGATAGRINPNGCVIYTTNTSMPQPDVLRTLPLQATLNGLMVNQQFTGSQDQPEQWGYTGGSPVDAPTVAQAIATYISANGPLRMPAEICNVDAVHNLHATENVLGTRNDLVRQMVGELTTQSNVFSVWSVGQVIQKLPGHTQYGEFEVGDQVLGEVRLHLILERYLDPGADGIYGNSKIPGVDNVVGSFDDPIDSANHPRNPRYLYRVVRSEEVR